MKKRLQGAVAGFLAGVLVAGGVFAAGETVRIVIDGKEIHPTDVKGNSVAPIVQNGTTYLPVRAVAESLGKSVYWDGPGYTVYIGDMNGTLEYPTARLEEVKDIASSGSKFSATSSKDLIDNYGNNYVKAFTCYRNHYFETLLDGRYSRFKGTIYVPQSNTRSDTMMITIEADGHEIYTSPRMDKTSRPIDIDIDISNYNDFKIKCSSDSSSPYICIGDAGFYQ